MGTRLWRVVVTAATCVGWTSVGLAQTDVVSLTGVRVNSAWNDERYVKVATGKSHSVLLRPDGSVEVWGSAHPFPVEALPPGIRIVELAAGHGHSLALRSDGEVIAWGSNHYGQCDVPELAPNRSYVSVAAGDLHSLALLDNGELVVFGGSHSGQADVPALPDGIRFVQIAAASTHSIALRSDGQAVSWGGDRPALHAFPPASPENPYVQVATGWAHHVLLRADGSVVGHGMNFAGMIDVPAPPPGTAYVKVGAGSIFSVTLRSDGRLQFWGSLTDFGEVVHEPVLPPGRCVTDFVARSHHVLLVLDNGAVQGVGYGTEWQALNLPRTAPGVDYVELVEDQSETQAGALLSDGSVLCWGWGGPEYLQVPELPPGTRYTQLEFDSQATFALRDDGELLAWGNNISGLLDVPRIAPGLMFTDLAASNGSPFAVVSDGSIVGWGYDDGWTGLLDIPDLPPGTQYVSVSSHETKAMALRSDGQVVAWGLDEFGFQYPAPAPPGGQVFLDVSSGGWSHVARTDAGEVAVWGSMCSGPCEAPLPPDGTHVVDVAAGYDEVFAVLDDGALLRLAGPDMNVWQSVESLAAGPHLAVTASRWGASATVAAPICDGSVRSYCPPTHDVASGREPGRFEVLGCPDHDLTSLTFVVHGLPAGSQGFFVYGQAAVAPAHAPGTLCLAGPILRVPTLLQAGVGGSVSYGIDVNAPPFHTGGGAVLPGSTWAYQFAYREPSDPRLRTTNAVELTFAH